MVELQVFRNRDVFDVLRDEWNPLLKHSQADHIFLTHDWQQTWWQAYHPGDLLVIAGRNAEGELVGIAPWFIEHRSGQRIIRTVGCVEVTDYLEVIAASGYEEAFFSALANHLSASVDDFDKLDLCNIPATSPTLVYLPEMLKAQGFQVTCKLQEVCPIIKLPSNWESYLAQLDRKQRHELRRKLRRAEGQATWYIVGPEHDLQAEQEKFLRLMAASSEEKAAFLENEQNRAFFRMIIPRLMERGWLMLSFLNFNGQPAASYLNFDYNNRILVYNSGQDVQHYSSLSPGIVLLAYNIRHAIEQGRTEFDFLRGDESYKYQMGGQNTEVYMLIATRDATP
ncbi:MAG: GNAT family N-acetyltransferase [Anaerolineae bacterium]